MRVSEVPLRYARALFELAKEIDSIDLIKEEIFAIRTLFDQDQDIAKFIQNTNVSPTKLAEVMSEAFKNAKTTSLTKDFIDFLVEKNRLYCFSAIVEAFQTLSDNLLNVRRGTVSSAVELTDIEKKDLEKIMGKVTKRTVLFEYQKEETLVGGLVARVGGYSFDDSIAAHLVSIKEQLKKRSIH
jgi:F-type H+-transporting ATPase subunit delta